MPHTYTMTEAYSPDYGDPVGFVTDALTGIATAYCAGDRSLQLGVPLCSQCDAHVTGDVCEACETPAMTEELARFWANSPFAEMARQKRADAECDARWAAEEAAERRAAA